MAVATGFWSYVHQDDEAEGGRISRLARDVVARYEMITGESIELFLDRDNLRWGDEWQLTVDTTLASVAFFIPVLTPRYFQSVECRRELNLFARKATQLGVTELVMPILYVDVPALRQDRPSDEAMALVRPFQWEEWTELYAADPASSEYRRGVARLATRLAAANASAEQAEATTSALELIEDGNNGDSPGLLDRMAGAEEALPQWTATLLRITHDIEAIGQLGSAAAEDIRRGDSQGKGFAARLSVARRLAKDLEEPAKRIEASGQHFTAQLHSLDSGIRVMIELAPAEVQNDERSRQQICEFFNSIRQLSATSEEGLGALQQMTDALEPLEQISRDLRPQLRRLRQAHTVVMEGRQVTREWVGLINAASVECGES